ncbi:dephospho-CoA kinase [Nocardia thailandica]|uniref:dephospho-CoA kinase n=1 Tax=Nocardia thailandica TaxID=257275 RepID=UPI0002E8E32D|nr:dephospho-CoA kinase [Nocardia thailandica]
MLRVGLTGGMGAGKSTVARELVRLGAVLVDSDVIAREVVAPGTPGLAALAEAFGPGVLADDGSLDRPALAAVAFADDAARARLNGIVHPLVGARTAELIAAAPADAVVVQDVPLLVENGLAPLMNLVLIVHAEEEERVRRLVTSRGVDEADARARIAAQATDDQRRAAADVWLDNGGEPGRVEERVRALWTERLVPFEANLRAGVAAQPDYRVVSAEHAWAAQARRVTARLWLACGAGAVAIDHVGPTAVPGLDAPDILDLQITVADAPAAAALAAGLTAAGFPPVADGDADPAEAGGLLHGSADPGRPAVVHVRVRDTPAQRFALALRDRLRADAELRADYAGAERAAEAAAAGLSGAQAAKAYRAVEREWCESVRARVEA